MFMTWACFASPKETAKKPTRSAKELTRNLARLGVVDVRRWRPVQCNKCRNVDEVEESTGFVRPPSH